VAAPESLLPLPRLTDPDELEESVDEESEDDESELVPVVDDVREELVVPLVLAA
jgi:hypothetical protein